MKFHSPSELSVTSVGVAVNISWNCMLEMYCSRKYLSPRKQGWLVGFNPHSFGNSSSAFKKFDFCDLHPLRISNELPQGTYGHFGEPSKLYKMIFSLLTAIVKQPCPKDAFSLQEWEKDPGDQVDGKVKI